MKKTLAAAALLAAPLLALAAPEPWSIDASHSTTSFSVKHLVVSRVRGEFGKTSGTIALDPADPARSKVEATIDATTVNTREPKRDEHLKSADFLDVAKYPSITFRSTKVAAKGKDHLAVTGELTLHGVTRPVTLDVTASPEVKGMYGETRRAYTATARIERKDFGLTWNKAIEAGPVIGDQVDISIDVEAVKDVPKTAAR
ncbi:YceI family protein [Anaeromyxobacter paludicola]|uniref:Polyisoprenoid-binding protein n=1 Tax=Anaeromyxobacter paludicola TaxID=2918171 RepID=A0ABN6N9W4_9BACT|nr:YceI family protein [Anaeromyxobacter paludicola]BDG09130.1 polyisoprenoid-binding protein [Anaeromyxobacter paludicola]